MAPGCTEAVVELPLPADVLKMATRTASRTYSLRLQTRVQ